MAAGKRIDRRYLEHFARELQALVRDRYDNNQTAAAKALGISQTHISHLIAAEGRGPGLNVLLRLREKTGRSIDELLGLPPPSAELTERLKASLELEVARFRAQAKAELEDARTKLAEAARLAERKDDGAGKPRRKRKAH